LLSEVPFAAALVYSPRGQSAESKKSRDQVRDPLKRGAPEFLRTVTEHLRPFLPAELVAGFLAPDVVLVPTPRRTPLPSKDSLWPSRLLAEALVRGGLGSRVLSCLVRTEPVPKSAFAAPGERPLPERHYATMRVERNLLDVERRITLVDDFVTKGATLIAAASRVKDAFPAADVRVFALVRTMGLVPEIKAIGAPCMGKITFNGVDVERLP
jgi:phosphoribosylpyrophosphate synthetase